MSGPVEFLTARLDDDEAYARNAFGSHNDAIADWHEQWSGAVNIGDTEDLIATNDSQVSRFIARHDPARVLREVAAKRAILRRCAVRMDEPDQYPNGLVSPRAVLARQTIMVLVAIYSDHPDYDQEWSA